MSKKTWVISGIIAVVVIVAVVAIVMMSSGRERASLEGLTEEEKYIQFQAEVACEMFEMTEELDEDDPEAGMAVFGKMIILMQTKINEYGYTEESFQNLSMKYDDDPKIEEKGKKLIGEMCPEALENMDQ